MNRAKSIMPRGQWSGEAADHVILNYEGRWRRRIAMIGEGGLEFLLDLPKAQLLRDGDGLKLDDNRIVEVRAQAEVVTSILCKDPHHLVRIAWHLGNRHLPTEILADSLRIRHDHVIEAMVIQLGAKVEHINVPFNPEGGAYGHGHVEGHDHSDD